MSRRRIVSAILWIIALAAFDQLVKGWIIAHLAVGDHITLLPFLSLYHTQNTGIAFSFLSSFHETGLIALTLAVIGLVFWLWWKNTGDSSLAHIGYLLIIGGALGNLIDRVRLHYVTDYILFHIGNWSFAVFNLADAFITIGAALIVLHEIISSRRDKRNKSHN